MEVPPFDVFIDWDNGQPVVHIRGELDYATAPTLQRALKDIIAEGAQNLLLDFHEVTFLDSEGLKVLLQAYRELRNRGGSITVQGCSQFVAKTFEILGLESYFEIYTQDRQDRG